MSVLPEPIPDSSSVVFCLFAVFLFCFLFFLFFFFFFFLLLFNGGGWRGVGGGGGRIVVQQTVRVEAKSV